MRYHLQPKPNNKIVRSAKIIHLISSGLFWLCGVLIMSIPQFTESTLCIMIGIVNIVIGCAEIYGYFSNDAYRIAFQSDFAIGIFHVVFGILMITNAQMLTQLLPCAVSILIIMDGGNKSQNAVEGLRFGMSKWYIVMMLAVVEIVVGILNIICIAYNLETRIWLGMALILIGIASFCTTMYMVRIQDEKRLSRKNKGEKTDEEN